MCSECKDISDRVNMTLLNDTAQECSSVWQLPSGLNLTLPTNGMGMNVGPAEQNYSFPTTTHIMSFRDIRHYPNSDWGRCILPRTHLAVECSLYPCVRRYGSFNVSKGQSSEVFLATHPMAVSTFPNDTDVYSATPMPCLINGTYYNGSSFTEPGNNSIPVSGLLDNNQSAHLPQECYFAFTKWLGLVQYLPEFLTGYVMDAPEVDYADPAWMGLMYMGGNATLETINAT